MVKKTLVLSMFFCSLSFAILLKPQDSRSNPCENNYGSRPPGWSHGQKRGFVNGMPPGQAKKCENGYHNNPITNTLNDINNLSNDIYNIFRR